MGSSQTRARTHVPCIGRQILNHCATVEAQEFFKVFNKVVPEIVEILLRPSYVEGSVLNFRKDAKISKIQSLSSRYL